MPKSRGRKSKPAAPGRRPTLHGSRSSSAPAYVPAQLPEDEASIERLLRLPPEQLPTFGLALWYLLSSPDRRSNQCLAASLVLQTAMRALGVEARTVALMITIPWARGGRGIRYGDPEPMMRGAEFIGHAGLLVDGLLLDPTAMQFPELRARYGSIPLAGRIGDDDAARAAADGAEVHIRLREEGEIIYTVLPEAAVVEPLRALLASQKGALAAAVENLLSSYAAALGQRSDETLERLRESCPRLAEMAQAARGRTVMS